MSKNKTKTLKQLARQRNRFLARFPLVFIILGTFGVVSIYYGLQNLLERITFLANNPVIALAAGTIILLLTGTLYKKLG